MEKLVCDVLLRSDTSYLNLGVLMLVCQSAFYSLSLSLPLLLHLSKVYNVNLGIWVSYAFTVRGNDLN